jgi:biopolymer transport protein ExbD
LNKTLALSIDQDGRLFLDGKQVEADVARRKVRAAKRADPEVRAVIAADGRARHEHVVRLVDLLRKEQVTEFALDVRPEDLGQTP